MSSYSYDESYDGHEYRMYYADDGTQWLEVRADNFDGEMIYESHSGLTIIRRWQRKLRDSLMDYMLD